MTDPNDTSGDSRRELERAAAPGDAYVLVELPSGEERLEPLLDLSPTGVAILLRSEQIVLEPGTVLPRLRFFNDGECTLQSRATVRDVTPMTLDNGAPGYKLGLQLEAHEAGDVEPAVTAYDQPALVTDAILNLVTAKAVARIEGIKASPFQAPTVIRFGRAADDRSELILRVESGAAPELETNAAYDIAAELYGTRLAANATLLRQQGVELTFAWPTRLRVWRHRAGGRLHELPEGTEVEFESPFVSGAQLRPVLDVSPSGLSFESHTEDGLLVGMLLRSLTLRLPNGTLKAQAVVRNVRRHDGETQMCGVELTELSENNKRLLAEFVDSHFHPEVRQARASDLRQVWPVYEESGLLGDDRAAVAQGTGRIESTRQALMSRGRQVSLQIVGGSRNELQGVAELLRSWGGTWTLQHVGTRHSTQLSTADLVVPLIQMGTRRTDLTHLHAWLDPARSEDGFARLRAIDATSETLQWRERVLMRGADGGGHSGGDAEVQDAGTQDLDWVAQKLGERIAPLEAVALRLTAAELRLDDTSKLFHGAGIKRRRIVRMAMSVSGPAGVALVDFASPGVSFEGHGNVARLYGTVSDPAGRQSALRALAADAQRVLREAGAKDALLLVDREEVEWLEGAGYTELGRRIELFATREGAQLAGGSLNLLT